MPRTSLLSIFLVCSLAGCAAIDDAHAKQRPDSPASTEMPPNYGPSDVVETYDSPSGFFRVHYTRAGIHAVPSADADMNDLPDHVEQVGALYDDVLVFYRDTLGLTAPPSDLDEPENGGDGRFDVYLLDFGISADGAFRGERCDTDGRCYGYMVQENDFNGRGYPSPRIGARVVGSHEFFHTMQAGLGLAAGSVISEGTAVWATEAFDGSLMDLEGFADGYLSRPERSLGQEPTGPVDEYTYGAGIFFRFLEERYDRELLVSLVATGGAGPWLEALDAILIDRYDTSFAEAYAEHVIWNLYTATRADPAVAYENGASYPPLTARDETLPFQDESIRVFPAAARFYQVPPAGASEVALELVGEAADLEGLVLILAAENAGRIRTVVREDASAGRLSLPIEAGDQRVHAIVANGAIAGSSRVTGMCLGAPSAVDACRTALGGGSALDGSLPDGGVGTPMGSGSCAIEPGRGRTLAPSLVLFLVCVARRSRRRRN